ncbi:hypothetical protein [Mesobacillus harenae]|uniref:hypothetical protein n=1 Tax=Mesobacillus harenae TaxID=2213203 RepID=UPI00158111ED|nr:hypothetical protein [Mesobacillus harenae]
MKNLNYSKKTVKKSKVFFRTSSLAALTALVILPISTSAETTSLTTETTSSTETSQTLALAGVSLFSSETITATPDKVEASTKSLTLNYSGTAPVNIDLLNNAYIVYKLPEEFKPMLGEPDFKNNLTASYDVPIIDLLNLGARDKGDFGADDIQIDSASNSVYMSYNNLLSLSLLSDGAYNFSLTINFDSPPVSYDGVYTFQAFSTDAVVNQNLIPDTAGTVEVTVPATETVPETDPETEPAPDPETDPDPETNPDPETDPDPDKDPETDPDKDPETDPDKDPETDSGTDPDPNQDSEDDSKVGTGTDTGPGTGTGNNNTSGERLPDTATNTWTIGLLGLSSLLLGFAGKIVGRFRTND